MHQFSEDPSPIVNTLASLYKEEGDLPVVEVLAAASPSLQQTDYDNWNGGTAIYTLYLRVPASLYSHISARITDLHEDMAKRARSILTGYDGYLSEVVIAPLITADTAWRDAPRIARARRLAEIVSEQKNLLIAVATGGPRIGQVTASYDQRQAEIRRLLSELGLADPNPFTSLWDWYAKWSTDLPRYVDRRRFISELYGALLDRLNQGESSALAIRAAEPSGWEQLDIALSEARNRLFSGKAESDFQAVGLLCREILISLAQTVFDPARHSSSDTEQISQTDAKRMLDAYLASEFSGSEYEVRRKHIRSAIDLANELQHCRSATPRDAALCLEATITAVNLIAIMSGARKA